MYHRHLPVLQLVLLWPEAVVDTYCEGNTPKLILNAKKINSPL